jgi:hypothetical protein
MKSSFQALLFLAAATSAALPAAAQLQTPHSAARVTLVAGPSPSRGGRTEVVRRAQRSPMNIVIVDANATADDLAGALALLNALRARYGDGLTSDLRARPDVVRHGPRWEGSAYRSWLVQQLVRLRRAPEVTLDDLGAVRTVQITLPAPSALSSSTFGQR